MKLREAVARQLQTIAADNGGDATLEDALPWADSVIAIVRAAVIVHAPITPTVWDIIMHEELNFGRPSHDRT